MTMHINFFKQENENLYILHKIHTFQWPETTDYMAFLHVSKWQDEESSKISTDISKLTIIPCL